MTYIRHDINNNLVSPQPGVSTVSDLGGVSGWSTVTYENYNSDYIAYTYNSPAGIGTRTPGTYQARNTDNSTRTPAVYIRHDETNLPKPVLDLRFALNKSLTDHISGNNLITFTRASSATYVGADGLIKTTPVNLLTRSEEFDQWTIGGNTTVTPNAVTAPDGTLTADRVLMPLGAGSQINKPNVVQTGITYTASVWAKAVTTGSDDKFRIRIGGKQSSEFTATGEWQRFTFTGSTGTAGSLMIKNADQNNNVSDIYFWGAQLEKGSTATAYIPTTSTISGAPRFDHDPATGESLGLLIEEARTNEITNNFTTGDRTAGTTLSEVTSITNPDGTTGTIKVTADAGANAHTIEVNAVSSGVNHSCSCFIKKGNHRYVGLSMGGTPNNYHCIFDFDTKTIINDGGAGNHTFVSAGFEEYANGWFRLHVIGITSGSRLRVFLVENDQQNNLQNWTATGSEFMYVWGPQLEEGSFPTSYIPTSVSTVTRAAGVAEITGTNFSSFYNQSEGTVFALAEAPDLTNTVVVAISDGTNANKIEVRSSSTDLSKARSIIKANDILNFDKKPSAKTGRFRSIALAYKADDSIFAVDGTSIIDGSVTLPSVSKLYLGNEFNDTTIRPGHIKRLAYIPHRLPDTIVQSMTS